MPKEDMKVAVVLSLKDRLTGGLARARASMKGLANEATGGATGGFRSMIGGWLGSMRDFEKRVDPWKQRIRKALLMIFAPIPGPLKFLIGPIVDLVGLAEKKLAAFRSRMLGKLFPGAEGGGAGAGPAGAGGGAAGGTAAGGAAARVFNLRGPLAILGAGLNLIISSLQFIGGLAVRVFKGFGAAIVAAARIGVEAFKGLLSVAQRFIGVAQRIVTIMGAVGLAAAAAVAYIGKSSLDAAMQMEGFLAKLTTATKSGTLGKAWMDWAIKFAAQTPFQVNEVVDAATRLLLQGFNPAELMTQIGNMAGAMNKPVTDAVEAYLDATRGEWERLKEFGITPRNLVAYGAKESPMGGIATQSEEDAAAARSALDKLMAAKFGGGMAQMMKTSAGQISNLKDAIFQLKVTIGNLLLPVLKAATTYGQEFVAWLQEMKVGERIGAWIALLAARILWFGKAIGFVIRQVAGGKGFGEAIRNVITQGFGKDVAHRLGSTIDRIIMAVQRLWKAITTVFSNLTRGITSDPAAVIMRIVNAIAAAIEWLTTNVFAPGRIEGIVAWFGDLRRRAIDVALVIIAAVQYGVAKLGGVQQIIETVGGYFRWLVDWGKFLVGWFYANLPKMLEAFGTVFGTIAEIALWLGNIVAQVFTGILTWVQAVIAGLNQIPGVNLDKAEKFMAELVERSEVLRDLLQKGAGEAAKIAPWAEKTAAEIRNRQAATGFQAPPMPGDVSGYLPPPVNVNITINAPNATAADVAREVDKVVRKWRYALVE